MTISSTTIPDRIQDLFREAVAEGVFPGAVLRVQSGGEERWHAAFGVADRFTGEPVQEDTFYDLASLTKPLCTTLAILRLIQSGHFDLENHLGEVAAVFSASDKANITIRHLLSHQSGLPVWRPYYKTLCRQPVEQRRDVLIQLLVREPLAYRPGAAALYSDLDFMVLQAVVEASSGQSLDQFVAQSIYGPLGIDGLFFTDTNAPPPSRPFAATEKCPWRDRVLKGHVHDDNAYALGGVAGHAGLFGTAAGVTDLLSALLCAGSRSDQAAVLDPALLHLFFQRQVADWALGFDTPSASGSSSGSYFSSRSVGHLGFTGTSFWMDLDRQVIVVLLTNRVHPSRADERIRSFRPLIHDLVMDALGYG